MFSKRRHESLKLLAIPRPDDADLGQQQLSARNELNELRVGSKPSKLVGVAPEQEETFQISAVRLEQDPLETVNFALPLQSFVILHYFIEQAQRLLLSPAYRLAPPQ